MNARFLRRNRLLAGLFTAVLATGIVAGTAAPASAGNSHHKQIDYVALGDSYAAGQGGGDYLDECHHTKKAYPRAVDRMKGVKLIGDATCHGATSWHLLKHQIPDMKWKIKKAELVTITVGAADVVLNPEIVAACTAAPTAASTAPGTDCETLVAKAIKKVKERVFKALLKIEHLNHKVKVIVTGYPHLYEAENEVEARINAGVDALNTALYWAVKKAKHWGVRAKYVDVTGIFDGHGINSDHSWIHPEGHQDQWHPTKKGHWAYSHVVKHAVKHIF